MPGVEPRPYIIRFVEDKPNPLYRRICYTFAWSIVVTFAVLNFAGLLVAVVTGVWRLKQIYRIRLFSVAGTIWALGVAGVLPRVKPSTKGEGHERRYFYGAVWASCIAQPVARDSVEAAAAYALCRRGETGGIRRAAVVLRHSGAAWTAPENPPDCSR